VGDRGCSARSARGAGLGLLLALLAAPDGRAADWLYTVRPGDSLWSIADRHLLSRRHWLALGRHNGLAEPDALAPGMLLKIPVAWLRVRPAPAELVAVTGAVELLPEDDGGRPARAGDRLLGGETLVASAEGSATVRLADGSELEIGPGSQVTFDRLSAFGRGGMIDTRVRLASGRLRAAVARGSGGLAVETPVASAAVRGTAFRVGTTGTVTTTEGLEGTVEVEARGVTRRLVPGTGTLAREGEPPAPPRPLLAAPRPTGALRAETVPQRVRLEPLAGASAYRVEVLGGAGGAALLASRLSPVPELGFDLPDGRYALRARGVDRDGIEGRDLEAELVIDARPEPPVPLRPRQGAIERQERPRFAWAAPEGATGYRFRLAPADAPEAPLLEQELAEPTATTPFPLPPGRYTWRVATLVQGELGPYGQPVRFERLPASPTPEAAPSLGEDGLALRWPPLEPGQSRQVQLARDSGFAQPALERTLAGEELVLPWPDPGRWYLRTRILEPDGEPGTWSPAQAIDVPWRSLWPIAVPVLLVALALLL
jgi:hypothetical protein